MQIILTLVVAFISTNIDDIFLLMLFFGNKHFKSHEIIIGQFLGISILIVVSFMLSLIGLVIDQAYVGLLGFVPVYLGVKGMAQLFKKDEAEEVVEPKSNKSNIIIVSGTTIANGGDNIGIYVPLLATLLWPQKITMIVIFLVMTIAWCFFAWFLVKRPMIAKGVDRYGHFVTPFVLVMLGLYILYQNGSVNLVR